MQTIKLTDATNDKVIRVCPAHIVAYWWQDGSHTYIMLNKSFATVKESPEDIDKLIAEAP